ncbi:uncharacterized protein LOC125840611 [Solanum verrucosum]|uniref:uncharacterized protein LOC125840611 n=1 Tax=Solanum verrucosum TaxID=315347 RepID=UPI0020D1C7A3|nr:uncharacterized protein LOC125840611 [Solanum verrucosum]
MWALKKLNLDWGATLSQRLNEMNEVDEFGLKAYESSALYKEKMKKLCLFPVKLKYKWTRPFKVTQVFPHGVVKLENNEGMRFTLNGQQIKVYLWKFEEINKVREKWDLDVV